MSGAVARTKPKKVEKTAPIEAEPSVKFHHWLDEEIHRLALDVLEPFDTAKKRDAQRIIVHFLSADDLVRYREAYLAIERTLPYI